MRRSSPADAGLSKNAALSKDSVLSKHAGFSKSAGLVEDTGAITVLVAAGCVAFMSLVIALAMLASFSIGSHQAQLAADMSAISGATAALYGQDGCTMAIEVAQYQHAQLQECTQDGFEVTLVVSREIWGRPVQAQARAGPWPADAK